MGTDFAIACIECRIFIDLHKWPVIKESGKAFDFNARFLPRNLVDDFSLSTWDQVVVF